MLEAIGYVVGFAIGYNCRCKCDSCKNCELICMKTKDSPCEYIRKLFNFSANNINNSNAS